MNKLEYEECTARLQSNSKLFRALTLDLLEAELAGSKDVTAIKTKKSQVARAISRDLNALGVPLDQRVSLVNSMAEV